MFTDQAYLRLGFILSVIRKLESVTQSEFNPGVHFLARNALFRRIRARLLEVILS